MGQKLLSNRLVVGLVGAISCFDGSSITDRQIPLPDLDQSIVLGLSERIVDQGKNLDNSRFFGWKRKDVLPVSSSLGDLAEIYMFGSSIAFSQFQIRGKTRNGQGYDCVVLAIDPVDLEKGFSLDCDFGQQKSFSDKPLKSMEESLVGSLRDYSGLPSNATRVAQEIVSSTFELGEPLDQTVCNQRAYKIERGDFTVVLTQDGVARSLFYEQKRWSDSCDDVVLDRKISFMYTAIDVDCTGELSKPVPDSWDKDYIRIPEFGGGPNDPSRCVSSFNLAPDPNAPLVNYLSKALFTWR